MKYRGLKLEGSCVISFQELQWPVENTTKKTEVFALISDIESWIWMEIHWEQDGKLKLGSWYALHPVLGDKRKVGIENTQTYIWLVGEKKYNDMDLNLAYQGGR